MKPSFFLADPKAWTTDTFARAADGEMSHYDAREAACFCLKGIMLKTRQPQEAYERLSEIIFRKHNHATIEDFNDHPQTTHEMVLAALKEADL